MPKFFGSVNRAFVAYRLPFESPNLKSVLDQPKLSGMKLRKECDEGRIVVFFKLPLLELSDLSFGRCTKKDPSEFFGLFIYPVPREILLMILCQIRIR